MIWKISKVIKYGRYLRVVLPDHPKASKRGYIALHRVLMENELGRILQDNEVIHHVNGDGHDNRLTNLQVMTRAGHQSFHAQERSKRLRCKYGKPIKYKCHGCGKVFERLYRNRDKICRHFCSHHCVAKYAGKFKKGVRHRRRG